MGNLINKKITNMNQIIGGYKEFLIIDRVTIRDLLEQADELDFNEEAYSSIRAAEIRRVVEFLKDRNIYNKEFEFKK
jgi:hypothetical protein